MRAVVVTDPGVLELNYMWLPTWVGSNAMLKKHLEEQLQEKVVGLPLTEETLDEVNDMVIGAIEEKYPEIKGLRDYLDGLKFVQL